MGLKENKRVSKKTKSAAVRQVQSCIKTKICNQNYQRKVTHNKFLRHSEVVSALLTKCTLQQGTSKTREYCNVRDSSVISWKFKFETVRSPYSKTTKISTDFIEWMWNQKIKTAPGVMNYCDLRCCISNDGMCFKEKGCYEEDVLHKMTERRCGRQTYDEVLTFNNQEWIAVILKDFIVEKHAFMDTSGMLNQHSLNMRVLIMKTHQWKLGTGKQ